MQDAADFSFENAKACHAMVLTTMEFDRISWSETLELDRLRRQHAQRHSNPGQNQKNFKGKGVPNSQGSEKNEMPCKYFNDGYCSRSESHFTKGTWYLHICIKCRGDHAASTKKCKPKN